MMPPMNTDLLRHTPDTHRAPSTAERRAAELHSRRHRPWQLAQLVGAARRLLLTRRAPLTTGKDR